MDEQDQLAALRLHLATGIGPRTYAALGQVWLDAAEARGDRVALVKALEALTMAASRADAGGSTLMQLGRAWLLAGDVNSAERYLRQSIVEPNAHIVEGYEDDVMPEDYVLTLTDPQIEALVEYRGGLK